MHTESIIQQAPYKISTIFNPYGPIGGHFGGLIDIATKILALGDG
jgi:hypothetical protein